MFILSIKKLRHKVLAILLLVIATLSLSFLLINKDKKKNVALSEIGEYSLAAQSNDDRIKFLSQFGWDVNPNPIEISSITIPSKFNSVYENYNEIQRKQGLDLNKYKEKNCIRYTYQILNYKSSPSGVRANILVLNDKVIGGDICSIELDGFMHGFVVSQDYKPESGLNATTAVSIGGKGFSEEPIKSTFRETLDPDPERPFAPTD